VNQLPKGWINTKLGDIVEFKYGKGLTKSDRNIDGQYNVYGSNGIVGQHHKYLVDQPSLIVGRKGAIGEVHKSLKPCWPIDTTYYLVPTDLSDIDFLYYLIRSIGLKKLDKSTAIPGLNRGDAYQINIPLPPLPEQHRIVAKIEELFTRLDAGVAALTNAKTLLKQYRQAVLKAAVEGRLTEEWRKEHAGEIEPASVLLERIQAERKQRLGKNYKPPKPIDTSNLLELPEGWAWARVTSIGEVVTGTTPSKKRPEYYGNDYPFYKPTDLNCGYYVHKSADSLSVDGIKRARSLPANTILVTCIGATIGKTGLIRRAGASNQQINAILNESAIIPEYLFFTIISPFFQNGILSKASSTTLPILNKSKFEELPIMIPSTDEQLAIVSEIERMFSIIDESEQIIDAELQRAQSLRQSILKRAFAGKLVPQDPADEPASVLLERIRKEKKI